MQSPNEYREGMMISSWKSMEWRIVEDLMIDNQFVMTESFLQLVGMSFGPFCKSLIDSD
jgi:hypothetical protein